MRPSRCDDKAPSTQHPASLIEGSVRGGKVAVPDAENRLPETLKLVICRRSAGEAQART